MSRIDVGDVVPEVTLSTQSGEEIALADFHDQKVVVLFFYPKDGSPICTKEACAFRDAYEDFVTHFPPIEMFENYDEMGKPGNKYTLSEKENHRAYKEFVTQHIALLAGETERHLAGNQNPETATCRHEFGNTGASLQTQEPQEAAAVRGRFGGTAAGKVSGLSRHGE